MQNICNMWFKGLLNQKPHLIHLPLERWLQHRVVLVPTPGLIFDLHTLRKEV